MRSAEHYRAELADVLLLGIVQLVREKIDALVALTGPLDEEQRNTLVAALRDAITSDDHPRRAKKPPQQMSKQQKPKAIIHATNDRDRPRAYRPDEAVKVSGLGRTTIYGLLKSGKLASIKVGRARLIPAAELEKLLASSLDKEAP